MNHKTIEKYLKGIISPHERDEVMEWIEKDNKNKKEFLELRKLYDISIWNAEFTSDKKRRRYPTINVLWRVAAMLLILLSVGLIYHMQPKDLSLIAVETITCPQGQRLELVLSDGTKVWLNSNSILSFRKHKKGNARIVDLNGEAYFDVAPDKESPFIVKTEMFDITVLGTAFNVFAYNNSGLFECSLIEGSVSLKNKNETVNMKLKPNERAQLSNGSLIRSQIDDDEDFLWKVGIYSFKNQPLSKVFSHLSLLHEVNIELKNPEIGTLMCTGKFRNKDGIEHILSILQKNYGFSFKKDDDTQTYIIY